MKITGRNTNASGTTLKKRFTIEREEFSNELRIVKISCLVIIVLGCIIFNSSAIAFININNRSEQSIKIRIVNLLCIINISQIIGYLIELDAAINDELTEGACQTAAFTISMLTYTSIGYFVALTIERYIAIKWPYKHVAWFSDGRNTWWLGAPPVFGLLLAGAPLLGWGRYARPRDSATYCCISFDATIVARSYFIAASLLAFLLPLSVTAVCFASIISDLHSVANNMKRRYGQRSPLFFKGRTIVREQWLACLMNGFVYIGSWLPFASISCLQIFGVHVSETAECISLFMCKTSTISSPIIYCLIERKFRLYMRERTISQFLPTKGKKAAQGTPVKV